MNNTEMKEFIERFFARANNKIQMTIEIPVIINNLINLFNYIDS